MARRTLADDRNAFVAAIPRTRKLEDSRIGNHALRSALGWTEARYTRVREDLLELGAITRGRGRGGSVRRLTFKPVEALSA